MKFVNIDNLNNSIWEESPYGHVVIDNFLNENVIDLLLLELSKLTPEKSYYYGSDIYEKTKLAFNTNLGFITDMIYDELCSDEFINIIENKTNIKGLIRNSKNLAGAGVHKVFNGGYLTMHTDFGHADDKKYGLLDRRINLLLYMNPEWKEEYNGQLCLFDKNQNKITKKILPILNRCVIFNTTNSIHGHPHPMVLPEGVCRQALALYYYTKNTNNDSVELGNYNVSSLTWYKSII